MGVSLEELGRAYAQAIGTEEPGIDEHSSSDKHDKAVDQSEVLLQAPDVADSDGLPVTTEGALEAILFVGGESSQPVAIDRILGLFQE